MTPFSHSEFQSLFREERDRLFRFLVRLTRDPGEAEDLMQDTFLTVWRKRHQFEGRGTPGGYLRRTAYRLFLNRRERSNRRRALARPAETDAAEAVEPPVDGSVERSDSVRFLIERVRSVLDELPGPAREAFCLFRFEGYSCAEIADALDVPLKTVETRIARATRTLARRLHPYRHHLPVR